MDLNSNSSSDFIYQIPDKQSEEIFTAFQELPSHGFNILIKAKRFGKWFLLKGLKEEYRQDPVFQKVLHKEFEIMAGLSHPSIVSVFSKEEVAPYGMCIVMEYIDGITLTDFMLQQQTEEQRLRIFFSILDATRYIHTRQVVHRDLKPSNILVTHNNRNVKIIDFGLSDTDYYTILKEPAGTRKYMSPEQQLGSTPDVRNDIYSLGIILMNLNLGKSYQGIIKRCVAPIEKRFSDIDQLEKALQDISNRKKRRWLVGLTAVTIILASLIVWQSVQLQQLSDERSLSADSISAMKQTITLTNRKHNEKLKEQEKVITEISDSLERVNLLNQKLSYLEEHDMKVKQSIEESKKAMDRYILNTGVPQYLDTLSSLSYYRNERYVDPLTKLWEYIKTYCREQLPELTDNERSQIEYLLNNYVYEKYTKKWADKITKLSNQQTP